MLSKMCMVETSLLCDPHAALLFGTVRLPHACSCRSNAVEVPGWSAMGRDSRSCCSTHTTPCCPAEPARRFNDGKVSPQGTLLVGRMHAKWRDGERGRLYRLDPGSRCAGVVYLDRFNRAHLTPETPLAHGTAWTLAAVCLSAEAHSADIGPTA